MLFKNSGESSDIEILHENKLSGLNKIAHFF